METKTYPDLTGRTFGKLNVLWKHKQSINGGASWVCRCSCGHVDIIPSNRLLSGHNTHCRFCNHGRFAFHDNYKTVECILPTGDGFFIDFEDLPLVMQYKWTKTKYGYVRASLGSREKGHILLHRLIMDPPEGLVVDHINGNRSDCRRANMRVCTQEENSLNAGLNKNNQSGKKGVYYSPRRKRWYARIHRGVTKSLGGYDSLEEAARAYDKAAETLHGAYAKTNKALGLLEEVMDEEILELDKE